MATTTNMHGGEPAPAPAALLLIDVINDLEFPGGEALLPRAMAMAGALSGLKARAARVGLPCIYVNDNFGRWRSSFQDMITHCKEHSCGADVFADLLPQERDYFILKPRHSAFFHTPLELLLDDLEVGTVVLTGLAGNICVLFTAHDAHMRDFRVVVAGDATASNSVAQNDFALQELVDVVRADVQPADEIEFPQRERTPAG